MTILETWEELKLNIKNIELNSGLNDEEIDCYNIGSMPDELLDVLKDSNGQKTNSIPLFLELKNNILGADIFYYQFLSVSEILEIKDKIQSNTIVELENLYPFAELVNRNIGEKGFVGFVINSIDKKIYKMQSYVWDRFGSHNEFKLDIFANSLKEFLENQILWFSLL
ncbi:hypothetical protein [Dysgonomonas sp. 520]|uniref:hypothetical protein n=1 Tax=Dysgonomonas sp. 520 TaxID=2302931 RepID=UPI0013D0B8B0|nr:hypothetical protein [Dysgonomonas sp. 520]NDW11226.1 hypothetical protein [Dysgonomonas sp. 520]